MDHSGTAHHARDMEDLQPAARTQARGGPTPIRRTPMTGSGVRSSTNTPAPPSEAGPGRHHLRGTRPLRVRPVVWQSDVGEASPVWHALAVTDRFVVSVDLTITEAARMKTYASHVRFSEIPDIQTTSQNVEAGVTLRFGSARVTLPSSVADSTHNGQPPWADRVPWTPPRHTRHPDA